MGPCWCIAFSIKKTKSGGPVWNGRQDKLKIIISKKNDKFEVFSNYTVIADQVERKKKEKNINVSTFRKVLLSVIEIFKVCLKHSVLITINYTWKIMMKNWVYAAMAFTLNDIFLLSVFLLYSKFPVSEGSKEIPDRLRIKPGWC